MPLTPPGTSVTWRSSPEARSARNTLLIPSRSLTKYTAPPSGDHCGLTCFARDPSSARERMDDAGRDVDEPKTERSEAEIVQVRGESVGGKRDRLAVRRPRRVQIGKRVSRELAQRPCRERVDPEIGQSTGERREHDPRAVGRPARVVDFADPLDPDFFSAVGVSAVDEHQHRPPAAERAHREPAALRIPRAGRLDVLQAVEMRVCGGAHDLADGGSCSRVRHEQVERQPVAFRQKHHPLAIGAQCGSRDAAARRRALTRQSPLDVLTAGSGVGRLPIQSTRASHA